MLRIFAKMIETSIALTGPARRGGIDFVEIIEHRFDRSMHAIEIESVKADKIVFIVRIPLSQPFDKIHDNSITPHPCREPPKLVDGFAGSPLITAACDNALNT